MQKFLESLKRMASLSPRKKEPSPYADVMERTVAWSIDLLIVYYVLRSVFDRVAMLVFRHDDPSTIDALKRANFGQLVRDGQAAINTGEWGHLIGSPALHLYLTDLVAEFFLLGILVVGVQWLYGHTPGKWLLGLRIVRRRSLEPVARWRYALRYVAYIPSVGFFMLGVVACHFNRERRALHDMIAGTVVIQTRPQGWYWGKVKQGFAWVRNKVNPPKADNDNKPSDSGETA